MRTVRKVLRAIVGSQVVDEERLQTLFCEVEAVINGRPITPASEDPNDLEALTPSHLLQVGACTHLPLGGPDASTEMETCTIPGRQILETMDSRISSHTH